MNDSNKLRSFLSDRGLLNFLREFEDHCVSPASSSQSETFVMEVHQRKELKKRASDTRVSEKSESGSESDLDSFSDESNESNDEGFTQVRIGRLVSRGFMPLIGQGLSIYRTVTRRAPARAFTDNLSYAKATAGSRKDPPINSVPITSSPENIIIDIGEIVLLANKFKTATYPLEKILILAEHAPLVDSRTRTSNTRAASDRGHYQTDQMAIHTDSSRNRFTRRTHSVVFLERKKGANVNSKRPDAHAARGVASRRRCACGGRLLVTSAPSFGFPLVSLSEA
ncbi:hypothetical protein EVAR_66378_1 [Eumeta japonica]|uniref:Uncharacterized protein n=1 Tax=Eumeta variegata TaxID=151549 RepID=A0A4C1ZLY5_EUMVA|nr:hypothetical protein EVAR_66378_1 [Eumeta japonica]